MPRRIRRLGGFGRGARGIRGRGSRKMRLVIALVVAGFSLVTYLGTRAKNPVTGESQFVALSVQEEIALGLKAMPSMAARHGGLHPDSAAQDLVDRVGARLLQRSGAHDSPYQFEFHLLADAETINAFALPGGQIFITAALLQRLETEGQLAGVLGHEIGHVIERHGAEHLAKEKLTSGLTGAAIMGASDSRAGAAMSAAVAAAVGKTINMKFGRDDELESDEWAVRLTTAAGYHPESMIRVMEILAEAGGPRKTPEFFSTHPNPDNRIGRIQAAIAQQFPNGLPGGLEE